MSVILAFESSGDRCSVGLKIADNEIVKSIDGSQSHTAHLLPFTTALLAQQQIQLNDIDAFAFSAGPGSFTGIRLAASIAKALAYTQQKPVIPINSLSVLAASYIADNPKTNISDVVVVNDARMNECYIAQWHANESTALLKPTMSLTKMTDLAQFSIGAKWVMGDTPSLEKILPNYLTQRATAYGLLNLATQAIEADLVSDALIAEPIYLRGKSAWKTVSEQRANRSG